MRIDDPWKNLADLRRRVLSREDISSQEYIDALNFLKDFRSKGKDKHSKWKTFKEWCLDKWWDYQAWRNTRANN